MAPTRSEHTRWSPQSRSPPSLTSEWCVAAPRPWARLRRPPSRAMGAHPPSRPSSVPSGQSPSICLSLQSCRPNSLNERSQAATSSSLPGPLQPVFPRPGAEAPLPAKSTASSPATGATSPSTNKGPCDAYGAVPGCQEHNGERLPPDAVNHSLLSSQPAVSSPISGAASRPPSGGPVMPTVSRRGAKAKAKA